MRRISLQEHLRLCIGRDCDTTTAHKSHSRSLKNSKCIHEKYILLSAYSAVKVIVVGSITKDEGPNRFLPTKSAPKNSYCKSAFKIYLLIATPSLSQSWFSQRHTGMRNKLSNHAETSVRSHWLGVVPSSRDAQKLPETLFNYLQHVPSHAYSIYKREHSETSLTQSR